MADRAASVDTFTQTTVPFRRERGVTMKHREPSLRCDCFVRFTPSQGRLSSINHPRRVSPTILGRTANRYNTEFMAGETLEGAKDGRTVRADQARSRRAGLILTSLEELLLSTPLRNLSVDEIAMSAGISRARFYRYYKSKYEALAALLHQTADEVHEVYELSDSWFVRPLEMRPLEAMKTTFERMGDVWQRYGAAVREAGDMWNAVPEVSQAWQQIISGLIDATTAAIERERERGVAPAGPEARVLAQGLVWQGERLLFVGLINAVDAMTNEELAEVGSVMWMRAIYLADDPEPA
ncbi:TetR family transcriptional regulator [Haloechinothrix alba]